jgi:chromosome condensin MukBEF ATPase and DNA-binding subunit MukB
VATKKKTPVKKQKSSVSKKVTPKRSKSLDSKKRKRPAPKPKKKPTRTQKAIKKKRITRRGIDVGRKDRFKMLQKIRELEERLQRQKDEFEERVAIQAENFEETAQKLSTGYSKVFAFENLPTRMIHETALQHLGRVVKAMRLRGISADEGYVHAAKHTGMSPREAYTLFMYVGYGEFVA